MAAERQRDYIVQAFAGVDGKEGGKGYPRWYHVDTVTAASADAAITEVANRTEDEVINEAYKFAAVPIRSFSVREIERRRVAEIRNSAGAEGDS